MLKKTLIPDLLAGLTVSFAAISLGAAFGTLSGRGAFAGMLAAAVIPIVSSVFGGTRLQASGPTAPMTAVSALVIAFAYENFNDSKILAEQFVTLVFLLTGALLMIAGITRLGKFIVLVPQVIILGFMNGIALLIWVDQFIKLFGFGAGKNPLQGNLVTNVTIAFSTLLLIYLIPWLLKKANVPEKIRAFMPSILLTIIIMTTITVGLNINVEKVQLGNTIDSSSEYFSLLVNYFPSSEIFTFDLFLLALPYALQLTLLCYLDSLLTSLVIDKMTMEKTKQNKELIAQGLANGMAGLFQCIPGAQATIRSVLLLKEGAKSRLAGVFVGAFVILGIVIFKDYITLIASAVFVGVLFKAGLDVFDRDFIINYYKRNWLRSKTRNIQFGFILYTTFVTVLFDLNIAVVSGTILFFIAEKFTNIQDAEADFSKVNVK